MFIMDNYIRLFYIKYVRQLPIRRKYCKTKLFELPYDTTVIYI